MTTRPAEQVWNAVTDASDKARAAGWRSPHERLEQPLVTVSRERMDALNAVALAAMEMREAERTLGASLHTSMTDAQFDAAADLEDDRLNTAGKKLDAALAALAEVMR